MIGRLSFLTLGLAVALGACQPTSGGGSKRGATGNGGESGKNGKGSGTGGNEDEDSDPNPPAGRSGDKSYCSKVKDSGHGALAAYLYTSKEACDLSPWALTYSPAGGEPEETRSALANSDELRAYMHDFLNRVAKLPLVKPGRSFNVRIMVDDEKNAYADGRQNIVVNSAFLKGKIEPERILGVLCHEMTHSLRNDGTELDKYYSDVLVDDPAKNPKAKAFYDKADAYFAKAYDDKTNTYTHNKTTFDKLNVEWKAYKKDAWIFSKKIESTADVIGGGLCASIGIEVDQFRGVFEDLKAHEDGQHYRTMEEVQDGEQFQMKPEEVYPFVFSDDSHPTYDERISQIDRVSNFMTQYLGDDKDLLDEWNDKLPALVKKLNLGTSLTDDEDRQPGEMRVKNLTTGETEKFPRPKTPRGYRHGR